MCRKNGRVESLEVTSKKEEKNIAKKLNFAQNDKINEKPVKHLDQRPVIPLNPSNIILTQTHAQPQASRPRPIQPYHAIINHPRFSLVINL